MPPTSANVPGCEAAAERHEAGLRGPFVPALAHQLGLLGVLPDRRRRARGRGSRRRRPSPWRRDDDQMDDRPDREAPHHRVAGDREHAARARSPRSSRAPGKRRIAEERADEQDRAEPHQQASATTTPSSPASTAAARGRSRRRNRSSARRSAARCTRIEALETPLAELPDERGAQRMRQQEMRADEGDGRQEEASLRRHCSVRLRKVVAAARSGSGRAAWSAGCRAAGGPRRSTPAPARC